MKLEDSCKDCVISQALRVGNLLGLDDLKAKEIVNLARLHVKGFDESLTPPHNAFKLYEDIAKSLHVKDIYKEIKLSSSKKAKEFLPLCEKFLENSKDRLYTATKLAVVGNVIDLASQIQYDLKDEIDKVLKTPFAIDDFKKLHENLKTAKKIVYLADNAGEEIFDKLFIKVIKEEFSDIEIFYFTRGKPIINDLTFKEALNSKMDEVATVIDSGVPTPGFALEFANTKALKLFHEADVVIAKGMGNYECLSEYSGFNIFHLLKVKCDVVANALNAKLGDLVCKKA
ncbi:MAG: damage-control phosphatase ARMT1 family protein [Campylobacteraceae bacterium]